MADASGGTVARVDLETASAAAPRSRSAGARSPWRRTATTSTCCAGATAMLVHVDGATGEVLSRRAAGSDPSALALDEAYVWVADGGDDEVLRFER